MSRTSGPPFRRLLIANRGEIALRVLRTAQELGIEVVSVYSEADRNALHVRRADRAVCIGPPPPQASYLRIDHLLEVADQLKCDAVHPGYGFLAENARFAEACAGAGITFVGPSARAITLMGDKVAARRAADAAGVPLVPGLKEEVASADELVTRAREIGFPVMLKAAAGGGGKGIRIVTREKDLVPAMEMARAEARGAFGDDRVYLEKFLPEPRHVEIQVMADQHGNVVHYGERECSVQRRHQKVIEESPCAVLDESLRAEMGEAACRLARAVDYVGAGTVEFLLSGGHFYFLEMNTRLQVEHPVTEMCRDADLVAEQLRVAAGAPLAPVPDARGHAIEIRINAEDPVNFFPSLGTVRRLNLPGGPGVRIDSGLFRGLEVTPHYDSMLAKLIVHAPDRDHAIERARRALTETRLVGVATSIPVALDVLRSEPFRSGEYDTSLLEHVDRTPAESHLEVASLAAAVAKYLRTERVGGSTETVSGPRLEPWTLVDRLTRLGGRLR